PNGFSVFNNEYHLFYQYHPYSTYWGPMHWGHCKSNDFIKWESLPIALAPDEEFDKKGCFSGSAIEFEGKHVLIYTGVSEEKSENGTNAERQTQCIAIGDGVNYEKMECNPVITTDMIPEGSSLQDFRDPKMWRSGDKFYTVVGSRNEDGSGQALLYSSDDLKKWNFETVIDRSRNEIGRMWECPDFFDIDDNHILVLSPQEMKAEKLRFHSGSNTVYIIGTYDEEKKVFTRNNYKEIDYGLDFYAPQTLKAEDGRRIMIGWMNSWENRIVPDSFKWCGMMTIPRELTVRNGLLIQNPIREIENYHKNSIQYENVEVKGEIKLDNVSGRNIDMTVEFLDGEYDELQIKVAKNDEYETIISYEPKKNIVTFDRSYSGVTKDVLHRRSMQVRNNDRKTKMRIILDNYSAEIFVNDGEEAMTCT
ncbi:MAG: glycoside hydrolase family 32 protein, partial [Clostridium sp.]|nr:glycoside hydrolase family 32 protein [Clostridium sp.]